MDDFLTKHSTVLWILTALLAVCLVPWAVTELDKARAMDRAAKEDGFTQHCLEMDGAVLTTLDGQVGCVWRRL